MKKLMVTRFNQSTWNENVRWREYNNYDGCIYNSPVYIKETIPLLTTIYVIEMNNDKNEILGIGQIKNKVFTDRKYKIYEDNNYNRYTYRGNKRIDKKDINTNELEKIETKIFKSKRHLKRGHGISLVPEELTKEYLKFIENLFY